MSASAAPPISAEERAQSLRELRPMARGKYSRYTRQLISGVISGIEHDLEEDAAELRKLASLAGTDVVQQLLCKQVESIEAVLRVASAHADDGAVADDEGDGATAQDEKGAAAPPPEQKAPPKAAPTPAAASTASPKPAATDTPLEAELDPARWPLATDADLTVECWRSSHEPHRQIPRCKYGSKAARQLMEQRKPVVLTHAPLVASAAGKWDLAFLRRNLRGVPCTVYTSQTRHFRYWDEQKNDAGYSLSESGRTQKETMGIEDFCERVGLSVEGAPASDSPALRYYLQSALVDGVGDELMAHFRAFDWEALLGLQRKLGWGELTSNLLLVGQRGNTTPAHYDEQQNLFAQLHGKKRVVLFSPADFRCLYPFPLHHPCDRQAQVDLYAPDMQRFPRFTAARPLEAVLEPGEVLYIPQYWWHHIENL
jgi:hypoxia-inducible factor 1-alpha inhibitor (HIF hydroxylase)